MKEQGIKEYEKIKHCFGERLTINGVGFEDTDKSELVELINDMLNNNLNSEALLKSLVEAALDYLQFDLIKDDYSSCEQCGDWNSYEKYSK